MPEPMIEAHGLCRRFGDALAVDHVEFVVRRGEIFGFLGPNGAGKSTTVRMLTGYLPPSEGRALLAGIDVGHDPSAARRHIGVVPEEANVYADLTVWQNVMLMAELHGLARARRTARGEELLETFGLADRRRQKGRELSKGLRQRLMLCMALVTDAPILFLDEPTSGLDVASAHLIRDVVTRINRDRGATVFLTTHNIEEADALCHRVAIINRGRLAAIDTPRALRAAIQSRRAVEVHFATPFPDASTLAGELSPDDIVPLADGYLIYSAEPGRVAQEIATRASARGVRIASMATRDPSLEDVFLHITRTRATAPTSGGQVHAR
jgi:ABC-2 type transport system ATP-binding protein